MHAYTLTLGIRESIRDAFTRCSATLTPGLTLFRNRSFVIASIQFTFGLVLILVLVLALVLALALVLVVARFELANHESPNRRPALRIRPCSGWLPLELWLFEPSVGVFLCATRFTAQLASLPLRYTH